PQLINVLRGEMSLVGPRPPLPAEVAAYPADMRRRLAVTPGLTGLWQVSGRSDLSWEETVRLDLRYVENWSFSLDLVILLRALSARRRRDRAARPGPHPVHRFPPGVPAEFGGRRTRAARREPDPAADPAARGRRRAGRGAGADGLGRREDRRRDHRRGRRVR